jgi:hypothetical protein
MKRKICIFMMTLGIFIMIVSPQMKLSAEDVHSDKRETPIDLIIALDKSLSMEEEIEAVKEWLTTYIVEERLIVGDYFLLIPFYRKSEVSIARTIYTDQDKEEIKRVIAGISADGSWTDIGNAFDRLGDELRERYNNNRKKSFLIVTDGINEPPPSSKYFRPDRKLVHEFYPDKIDEFYDYKDWKVLVLLIGGDTGFDVFQDDERVEYKTMKEGATPDDYDREVELIASINVNQEKMKQLRLNGNGKGVLKIPVETQYFDEPPEVVIEKISLITPDASVDNILEEPYSKVLVQEGEDVFTIDVNAKKGIKEGTYSTTLEFTFSSKAIFLSSLGISLHVNNFFEDNPWLIPLIILAALIIIILAIFGIYKIAQGHPIKFRVLVEEMPIPKGKDVYKIARNKQLYLSESLDFIRVSDKKTPRSFAKLTVVSEDLKLFVIKESYFVEPKDIPENVLENTIRIITESGKRYHVKFIEIT